ncbi:hypothetical protein C8J40_11433 [Sphingomonas sp. PP-CC-3A-396]|nr:hypothetical protein C8J40_11433 [Sphingomonas sp. PP-CC-3A-396]
MGAARWSASISGVNISTGPARCLGRDYDLATGSERSTISCVTIGIMVGTAYVVVQDINAYIITYRRCGSVFA